MNKARYFWSGASGHFYTDTLDAGEKIVKHLPDGEDYTATDLQEVPKTDVNFKPFPPYPYGNLMTAEEFKYEVIRCTLNRSSGNGYWSSATGESNLSVWNVKKPAWATHVMWYYPNEI